MSVEGLEVVRKFLDDYGADLGAPPEAARRDFAAMMDRLPVSPDLHFESVSAGDVPALWVDPPTANPDRVLVHFHGGGYAVGSHWTHRALTGDLARASRTRGFSVDYRLAPENPFPVAVDDAVAAYRWLLDQGFTSDRIVLAGDSAGGGLCIALTLVARRDGLPLPAGALLISPWIDLEGTGDSVTTKASVDPISSYELITELGRGYLKDTSPQTPLAAPLYADMRGLPPMLIQVGSAETLLDDANRLAARAAAADVRTRLDVWPDMIHVWHSYASMLPEARMAISEAGDFLDTLLATSDSYLEA